MKCFRQKNDLRRSQLLIAGGLLAITVVDPAWSQTPTSGAANSPAVEAPPPIGITPGAAVASGNAQSVASANGDKGADLIVVTGSRVPTSSRLFQSPRSRARSFSRRARRRSATYSTSCPRSIALSQLRIRQITLARLGSISLTCEAWARNARSFLSTDVGMLRAIS